MVTPVPSSWHGGVVVVVVSDGDVDGVADGLCDGLLDDAVGEALGIVLGEADGPIVGSAAVVVPQSQPVQS